MQEISAFETVAWRFTFGTAFLWIIAKYKNIKLEYSSKAIYISLVFALQIMILPISLITWSEIYIPSSIAGLLNALVPLMTIAISILYKSHRNEANRAKIIGMLVGFVGVFLIFVRQLSLAEFETSIVPQLAVVLAAAGYASGTLYGKQKYIAEHGFQTTLFGISWGVVLLWIWVLITGSFTHIPTHLSTWLATAWLGIFGSGLAFLIYVYLIQKLGAARTSGVAYLFPLTAYILGVLLLGEAFALRELLGGLLIFLGIYISRK